MRPTIAEINLSHLKSNFMNIRRKTNTKVMAVVKADAYGHGMIECVKSLESLEEKPDYYGVALTEEAKELREAGVTDSPILIFAPFELDELNNYIKEDLIPTLSTNEHLEQIKNSNFDKTLKVHINIDTGMGRVGISHDEAVKFIEKVDSMKNIQLEGIYTHFATSDDRDKSFAEAQFGRFQKVIDELKEKKIEYGIAHCANSGAILDLPKTYLDMVRVGISLYGYYPSTETTESIELKPVMCLKSKISTLREVKKGDSVSYGRIFYANRNTTAATVPVGYADGYVRALSNKANGIVNKKLCNQIGRVTMDRILFDVTDIDVKVGDEIILIGSDEHLRCDAWDWSKALNTIPYEITCNISKRVPRRYID